MPTKQMLLVALSSISLDEPAERQKCLFIGLKCLFV